ncbi:hypothetical protein TWF696_000285 [Orbilia brochopaga]|uniref:Uncharacterized protein n=1 Tax=Orbilia brochopaga TaxID=3140254 RepID=A0AAV9VDI6_9PEZI
MAIFTLVRHPPPPAPPPPPPPPGPPTYPPTYPVTPRRKKSWFRRKLLLFEVTFCPYVMTPSEKWAFYTFLFLFLGLFAAAVALYLPQHVQTVVRRAYFYVVGDNSVIRERDVPDYSTFETEGGPLVGFADTVGDGVAVAISVGKEELKSYMQT